MRLAAGGASPQANLCFAVAEQQRFQAGDDQLRLPANKIVETELAIERQR
jgi:hypothetical protein